MNTIRLTHEDGGAVEVILPMPMDLAGETLVALGDLGYKLEIPEGATKLKIEADLA